MCQCADAPPVVIVIRRPETVKRAGVRSTRSARHDPQAPAGACHALQHGALDMHDLVAEAGEQQAHLVACEGVDPLLALPEGKVGGSSRPARAGPRACRGGSGGQRFGS